MDPGNELGTHDELLALLFVDGRVWMRGKMGAANFWWQGRMEKVAAVHIWG